MKNIKTNIWLPVVLLPVWYIIYHNLQPVTNWLIDSVFGMTKGAHLTEALRFFVFEFPKVMMLAYTHYLPCWNYQDIFYS